MKTFMNKKVKIMLISGVIICSSLMLPALINAIKGIANYCALDFNNNAGEGIKIIKENSDLLEQITNIVSNEEFINTLQEKNVKGAKINKNESNKLYVEIENTVQIIEYSNEEICSLKKGDIIFINEEENSIYTDNGKEIKLNRE